MTELVVVVPVLGRPERVGDVLSSLEHGRGRIPYRALFVASEADTAQRDALDAAGAETLVAPWPPRRGDYAKKINLAARETTEPWIFCGADDLCWCPGWLDAALACSRHASVGVIGTNDLSGRRRGDHSTHSLVRRSYIDEYGTIDEPGLVLHEAYDHQFVDDELVATAKARGAYVYCDRAWVEHEHPHWQKGVVDATYRKGQARFAQDRTLFQHRRRLWASPRSR